MRVVVTGATGNVGTSLLPLLAADPRVESIVGLARRKPDRAWPKTTWVRADVWSTNLVPHLRGADVVVHLAWLISPSRDLQLRWRANVGGSVRVLQAVAAAKVANVVYASSVGAYSPAAKDRFVDESWPTHGIASSPYSREKAYVERLLDGFEREHPEVRVVRMRPALLFKRHQGSEVRRLFFGPLLPNSLVRPGAIPVVPVNRSLKVQALHTDDAASAYHRAITGEARGAFNLAADPVIDSFTLTDVFGAVGVPTPRWFLRGAVALAWRLRLLAADPGWVDLAFRAPLLSASRARRELDWAPQKTSRDAILELLEGIRTGDGIDTPPLRPDRSARSPLRRRFAAPTGDPGWLDGRGQR